VREGAGQQAAHAVDAHLEMVEHGDRLAQPLGTGVAQGAQARGDHGVGEAEPSDLGLVGFEDVAQRSAVAAQQAVARNDARPHAVLDNVVLAALFHGALLVHENLS